VAVSGPALVTTIVVIAGLPGSALYAGSWSEWIRDPKRPVATGP
jgi:3-mercaptopyruvate sulfurtransferase SseA